MSFNIQTWTSPPWIVQESQLPDKSGLLVTLCAGGVVDEGGVRVDVEFINCAIPNLATMKKSVKLSIPMIRAMI